MLPPWFDFASTFAPGSRVDFLSPFPISDETDQWGNTLAVIGRLRPATTIASAQADVEAMNTRLREVEPTRWGLGAAVRSLHDQIAGKHRPAMLVLAAAALTVLLIGCANLSNLLLARGRKRGKEMAVRSALGAGRGRLLRQLAVENLVLAIGGGLVGVFLAVLSVRLLMDTTAIRIPMLGAVSIDGGVLAFTLTVTLLAGLIAGIAPTLQVFRGREAEAMNELSRGSTEGRRGAFVREALVVGEVALACCLLVGMSLLLRSFVKVLDVDLGFAPEGAVMWQVDTPRPFESNVARVAYFRRLTDRLTAIPGVDGAGLTDTPPLGRNRSWSIWARGVAYEEGHVPAAFPRVVDRHYLEVMRIPLLAGRHFTEDDDANATNVVIVNETAAATLFPGTDAIGRTVLTFGRELQIVGVVGDVRHQSLEEASGLEIYLHMGQVGFGGAALVVRSRLAIGPLATAVRAALAEVDAMLPTGDYASLQSVVDRAVSPRRFILVIIGSFAGAALLLAALGIYAVLSYTLSQRVPEIGIRMALGESARKVRRRVVARTLLLAGIGIAAGGALAYVLSRLMQSLLYGVAPADPLAFGGVAMVLLAIATAAGYVPARRASRTDPMAALRSG